MMPHGRNLSTHLSLSYCAMSLIIIFNLHLSNIIHRQQPQPHTMAIVGNALNFLHENLCCRNPNGEKKRERERELSCVNPTLHIKAG